MAYMSSHVLVWVSLETTRRAATKEIANTLVPVLNKLVSSCPRPTALIVVFRKKQDEQTKVTRKDMPENIEVEAVNAVKSTSEEFSYQTEAEAKILQAKAEKQTKVDTMEDHRLLKQLAKISPYFRSVDFVQWNPEILPVVDPRSKSKKKPPQRNPNHDSGISHIRGVINKHLVASIKFIPQQVQSKVVKSFDPSGF
jgi:hypothetical protein